MYIDRYINHYAAVYKINPYSLNTIVVMNIRLLYLKTTVKNIFNILRIN